MWPFDWLENEKKRKRKRLQELKQQLEDPSTQLMPELRDALLLELGKLRGEIRELIRHSHADLKDDTKDIRIVLRAVEDLNDKLIPKKTKQKLSVFKTIEDVIMKMNEFTPSDVVNEMDIPELKLTRNTLRSYTSRFLNSMVDDNKLRVSQNGKNRIYTWVKPQVPDSVENTLSM